MTIWFWFKYFQRYIFFFQNDAWCWLEKNLNSFKQPPEEQTYRPQNVTEKNSLYRSGFLTPTCAAVKDHSKTSPSCHSAAAAADHRYYMGGTSMSNGTVFWKQSHTVCVLSRDFGFNAHNLWSCCIGIFSKRLSKSRCESQKYVFLLVRFSYVAYFATRSKSMRKQSSVSPQRYKTRYWQGGQVVWCLIGRQTQNIPSLQCQKTA